VTIGDRDEDTAVGAGDAGQLGQDAVGYGDEVALVDVRHGPVHGRQHAVGDDGRAGDGDDVPAAAEGHGHGPILAGRAANAMLRW